MKFRHTAVVFTCVTLAACRTSATEVRGEAGTGERVSTVPDTTRYDNALPLLPMVNRFARESGTTLIFDEDVERELERIRMTWISCFTNEPVEPTINLDMLKQIILRTDAMGSVHLEIEPVGPESSNTYVIRRRVYCRGTPDPLHRGV